MIFAVFDVGIVAIFTLHFGLPRELPQYFVIAADKNHEKNQNCKQIRDKQEWIIEICEGNGIHPSDQAEDEENKEYTPYCFDNRGGKVDRESKNTEDVPRQEDERDNYQQPEIFIQERNTGIIK
jgi:hypothetical protein